MMDLRTSEVEENDCRIEEWTITVGAAKQTEMLQSKPLCTFMHGYMREKR